MTRTRRIATSFVVIAVAFLLLGGYVLYWLKKPLVQSVLVKKLLTEVVGKRLLHADVQVGLVYVDVYDRIDIRDLFIEDWDCDTLLYFKRLFVDIDSLSIFNKALSMNEVVLDEPQIHFIKHLNEPNFNFEFLIEQFGKTNKKPKTDTLTTASSSNFWVDLKSLTINKPHFKLSDANGGLNVDVALAGLQAKINSFKPFGKEIAFETLQLESPRFFLTDTISSPDKEEEEDCERPIPISLKGWLFAAQHFDLTNGGLVIRTGTDTLPRLNTVNFKAMNVEDINLRISNLVYGSNDTVSGHLDKFTAKERSGLEVSSVTGFVLLSPSKIELSDLKLKTPNSQIEDYLAFKYSSLRCFSDFINEVKLDVRLTPKSYFTLKDIAYFVGSLHKEKTIVKHLNTRINISGKAKNEVSRLSAEGLVLQMGRTYFKGDVRMRGLPDFQSTNIDAKITLLKTDINEVKSYLPPSVKLPPELDKLGNIQFSGRYSGFPKHFVAEGTLLSDIGLVHSDVKIDIERVLRYSGKLAVKDFDVGKLLNKSEQFGKATFSATINGKGIKSNELDIKIGSVIESFTFNNYAYTNVVIDGIVDKKLFSGNFAIADENLNLTFKGLVNFSEQTPQYQFTADLFRLNLKKLNLLKSDKLKDDFIISGSTNLNLLGKDIDDIAGNALFYNVKIQNGARLFALDTVKLFSAITDNHRTLRLNSAILTADINGQYTFKELPNAFINLLNQYFPYRFKYTKPTEEQNVEFALDVNNPVLLSQIFLPELDALENANIRGSFNSRTQNLNVKAKADVFSIGGIQLEGLDFNAQSDVRQLTFNAKIDSAYLFKNNMGIPPISAKGAVFNDSIRFAVKIARDSAANRANIAGLIFANSDTLKLKFDTTEIVLNYKKWETNTGTFTYKNKNYFEIEDVALRQDDRTISLRSHPSRLHNNYTEVILENIYMKDFNYIPIIEKIGIETKVSGEIAIKDVFDKQIINAELLAQDFVFRKQPIGDVKLRVDKRFKEDDLHVGLDVVNERYDIKVNQGLVVLPKKKGDKPMLDVEANIRKGNLQFLEAFIGTLISRTEGNIKGLLRIYGQLDQPNFKGNIFVEKGGTTVDYLNTRYTLKNQSIIFDDKYIRFNNMGLNDTLGNTARANGYVFLNDMKNMSINLDITTDNLLLLNTKYEQNNLYYGTAFAGGVVRFRGPFNQLDLYINARSNKGTKFNLPISYDSDVSDNAIYTFINTGVKEEVVKPLPPAASGMKIQFDLEMTPDAEIAIIFDLQAGDIIKGRGSGNIQMEISTIGDFIFNMYGKYTIEEGSYLFTLQNIINKYFKVEKGGTVTFAGQPYDAQLDVKAIYSLKTNRDNLLNDAEIASLIDQADLKRRVPIDVFLKLAGSLLQPNIKFEVNQGDQPVTRVDDVIAAKLNELNQNNPNELNKQVFGLLVLNSFMSPDRVNLDLRSGVNTTVSELLSNYLSSYLNQVVSGLIPDSEFNINWRNYTSEVESQNPEDAAANFRNEIELVLTKRLFNDRLSIQLGGNVDVGNTQEQAGNQVFFAGDFVLEYRITPDGRYLVKAFNKTDYDILSGTFNKTGASLTVTQEFDNFKDLFKRKKKKKAKMVE